MFQLCLKIVSQSLIKIRNYLYPTPPPTVAWGGEILNQQLRHRRVTAIKDISVFKTEHNWCLHQCTLRLDSKRERKIKGMLSRCLGFKVICSDSHLVCTTSLLRCQKGMHYFSLKPNIFYSSLLYIGWEGTRLKNYFYFLDSNGHIDLKIFFWNP